MFQIAVFFCFSPQNTSIQHVHWKVNYIKCPFLMVPSFSWDIFFFWRRKDIRASNRISIRGYGISSLIFFSSSQSHHQSFSPFEIVINTKNAFNSRAFEVLFLKCIFTEAQRLLVFVEKYSFLFYFMAHTPWATQHEQHFRIFFWTAWW